jgi:hypothetical protein
LRGFSPLKAKKKTPCEDDDAAFLRSHVQILGGDKEKKKDSPQNSRAMHPYSGGSTLAAVSQRGHLPNAERAPVPLAVCSLTHHQKNSLHTQVLRVSAFSVGLVYGSWHLSSLKSRAAKAKAAAEAAGGHH